DLHGAVLVADRLMTGREIDDREAAMTQPDARLAVRGLRLEEPLIIRSTVRDHVGHAPERGAQALDPFRRRVSGGAAHGFGWSAVSEPGVELFEVACETRDGVMLNDACTPSRSHAREPVSMRVEICQCIGKRRGIFGGNEHAMDAILDD